jgi:hypothetical protein
VEIEKKPAGRFTMPGEQGEHFMGRQRQLKIRVDSLTVAWLVVRARQTGTSLSEYVRGLIVDDLSRPADGNVDAPAAESSTHHRISDTLADQLLELSLLTVILVRAQLSRAVGEEDARSIETRAKQKAAELVKMLLGDPGADSELEPVSPLE